jgi:Fe(3+) dicitrate transport protein
MITDYVVGKIKNTIAGGIRLYKGNTSRLADGIGSTGASYDVTIKGIYPKDINFESSNAALFIENIFRISDKLILIPGIRYEWLEGSAEGRNGITNSGTASNLQNITRGRNFTLVGLGSEYHITNSTEMYANLSQAYRPIQFANLQAPPTTDLIDPALKDAKGYNFDIGYRGKIKNYFQFDISGFYLKYNNRVGTISSANASYRLITNVGASVSKGIESYIEFNPVRAFSNNQYTDFILFSSYAYTNATYSVNHKDANTKGKKVENAPQDIFRGGISYGYKKFLLTAQLSFVGASRTFLITSLSERFFRPS